MISTACVTTQIDDDDDLTPPPPPPPADVTFIRQQGFITIAGIPPPPLNVIRKPKRHVRFQNTCSPSSRCRSPEDDVEVVEYVTDEL